MRSPREMEENYIVRLKKKNAFKDTFSFTVFPTRTNKTRAPVCGSAVIQMICCRRAEEEQHRHLKLKYLRARRRTLL